MKRWHASKSAKAASGMEANFSQSRNLGGGISKSDCSIVRVLLRSIETGLFYEEASKWTPDQTAAFDFEKTTRAVELIFATKLEGVEMLLTFENPQFDLILSVDAKNPANSPAPVDPGVVQEAREPGNPGSQNNTPSTSAL
jgi:hypothetical protein